MNIIIAVAGPPGAGKTSLINALVSELGNASSISYDSYQKITEKPVDEITELIKDGVNYNNLIIPKLAEDLKKIKNGESILEPLQDMEIKSNPYIFFETPFGKEHSESAQYIDLLLWIDIPFDIALARNLKSFTGLFLKDQRPEEHTDNIAWLDEYLANYLTDVRHLLYMQKERVSVNADIVVGGTNNIESMAKYAIKELLKRQ